MSEQNIPEDTVEKVAELFKAARADGARDAEEIHDLYAPLIEQAREAGYESGCTVTTMHFRNIVEQARQEERKAIGELLDKAFVQSNSMTQQIDNTLELLDSLKRGERPKEVE